MHLAGTDFHSFWKLKCVSSWKDLGHLFNPVFMEGLLKTTLGRIRHLFTYASGEAPEPSAGPEMTYMWIWTLSFKADIGVPPAIYVLIFASGRWIIWIIRNSTWAGNMAVILLLSSYISAPREAVYLEYAIVNAPILQDLLGCGVVVALIVCHTDPYMGRERPKGIIVL